MGQLLIHDVACPWGQNWWTPLYDLTKYHPVNFWVDDDYLNAHPEFILGFMEFKKWVASELVGEVIMRETGRSSGFAFHYIHILLDEDMVRFKLSKWFDILAK